MSRIIENKNVSGINYFNYKEIPNPSSQFLKLVNMLKFNFDYENEKKNKK